MKWFIFLLIFTHDAQYIFIIQLIYYSNLKSASSKPEYYLRYWYRWFCFSLSSFQSTKRLHYFVVSFLAINQCSGNPARVNPSKEASVSCVVAPYQYIGRHGDWWEYLHNCLVMGIPRMVYHQTYTTLSDISSIYIFQYWASPGYFIRWTQ